MYKLIAIYKIPNDIDAWEKHYVEVHTPLVKKVPSMKELRLNRITGTPRGASDLHVIAEMVFENKDDFKAGMSSEENMACGKDLFNFAKEIVSVHFAKEEVITL